MKIPSCDIWSIPIVPFDVYTPFVSKVPRFVLLSVLGGFANVIANWVFSNGECVVSTETLKFVSFPNFDISIELKLFLDSVDRVASVSLDKKDGVKFILTKDTLNLSVNNTNSGDGKESLNVKFDHDLEVSFNSRYLIDVASQLDGDKIEIFFNDSGSPALIKDPSDFDSIFVVMPMKG